MMTFKDLATHETSTSPHTLRRTMHCALFTCLPNAQHFFQPMTQNCNVTLGLTNKKREITMSVWKPLHFCWSEFGCGVWWGGPFINPRSEFRGTSCVWQRQWEHPDKDQANYSQEISTQGWLLTFYVYIFFLFFLLFSKIVLSLIWR